MLLLRERVDLPERLAAAAEPLERLLERLAILAGGRRRARGVEPTACVLRVGVEACELDVDRSRALACFAECATQLRLDPGKPAQLRGELSRPHTSRIRPSAERRLQQRGRVRGVREDVGDAPRRSGETLEQGFRHARHRRPGSDRGAGRLCDSSGSIRGGARLGGATLELLRFTRKRRAPRLELEQDPLRGLAGEPELSALRSEAVPLRGHDDAAARLEKLRAVDEPRVFEE